MKTRRPRRNTATINNNHGLCFAKLLPTSTRRLWRRIPDCFRLRQSPTQSRSLTILTTSSFDDRSQSRISRSNSDSGCRRRKQQLRRSAYYYSTSSVVSNCCHSGTTRATTPLCRWSSQQTSSCGELFSGSSQDCGLPVVRRKRSPLFSDNNRKRILPSSPPTAVERKSTRDEAPPPLHQAAHSNYDSWSPSKNNPLQKNHGKMNVSSSGCGGKVNVASIILVTTVRTTNSAPTSKKISPDSSAIRKGLHCRSFSQEWWNHVEDVLARK